MLKYSGINERIVYMLQNKEIFIPDLGKIEADSGFLLFGRNILSPISAASDPLMRISATPPLPRGVDIAAIVSNDIPDITSPENHSGRTAAVRQPARKHHISR